jgi:hypothetical protein
MAAWELQGDREMANAKDVARKVVFRTTANPKKRGEVTEPEKALIKQLVLDNPGPLTKTQTAALAKVTRRTVEQVQAVIEEAAVEFAESAKDYVWLHKQAASDAYATGDFETAVKAAQWAIEKMGKGKARIVENVKTPTGEGGTKIMIGIKLGGMNPNQLPEDTVVEGVIEPPGECD